MVHRVPSASRMRQQTTDMICRRHESGKQRERPAEKQLQIAKLAWGEVAQRPTTRPQFDPVEPSRIKEQGNGRPTICGEEIVCHVTTPGTIVPI